MRIYNVTFEFKPFADKTKVSSDIQNIVNKVKELFTTIKGSVFDSKNIQAEIQLFSNTESLNFCRVTWSSENSKLLSNIESIWNITGQKLNYPYSRISEGLRSLDKTFKLSTGVEGNKSILLLEDLKQEVDNALKKVDEINQVQATVMCECVIVKISFNKKDMLAKTIKPNVLLTPTYYFINNIGYLQSLVSS